MPARRGSFSTTCMGPRLQLSATRSSRASCRHWSDCFPEEVVQTVEALTALHALSEELDSEMARHIDDDSSVDGGLRRRLAGAPAAALTASGRSSSCSMSAERWTSTRATRCCATACALMRAPARAAGLPSCRRFWSAASTRSGRCAVRRVPETIAERERALARLFDVRSAHRQRWTPTDPLGQLP